MVERINTGGAKALFRELVDRVRETKQPIVIQRHNKDQVALVPLEMLEEDKRKKKKTA